MKKIPTINRYGEEVELVDGEVIPPGHGVRVGVMLMDSMDPVQREIAGSSGVRVTDSLGRASGHRPGHAYVKDDDDAAARKSYEEMKARNSNAWRGPVSDSNSSMWPGPWSPSGNHKPADVSLDSDAAYQAYRKRISEAWKAKPSTDPADISERTPLGPWVDKNPQRPPRDVRMDAAAVADSDAAWREMVARNENAWRGPGGVR